MARACTCSLSAVEGRRSVWCEGEQCMNEGRREEGEGGREGKKEGHHTLGTIRSLSGCFSCCASGGRACR